MRSNATYILYSTDYLREFHAHILNEMKKGFAQQFEGRYRYCLTVSIYLCVPDEKALQVISKKMTWYQGTGHVVR